MTASAPVVAVLEPGYADYATERRILARHAAVVTPVPAETPAVPALASLDPRAVLVRERAVGDAEMTACRGLRLILRYGVGVDNIDLDTAADRRIYVANVPDYGAEQVVSDHAVALYLAVTRRIVTRDRDLRRGRWGVGQSQPIPGHKGGTLGLIGFGRIARAALGKFRALGFGRVLVHDPFVAPSELTAAGVDPADVGTICRESDLISLHVPLTPETHHLLGPAQIGLMRSNAVIVNVSRGGLIDEAALAEALSAGRVFGAGLDVFEQEPLDVAHPLLQAPNTVLSDHAAWYSEQSVAQLQTKAAEEVCRVLDGQEPLNWVNRWTR